MLRSIAFWTMSVFFLALILASLGYRLSEALFVGTLFLPGALMFKYFIPKITFINKRAGIKDMVFVVLGVVVAEILLLLIAHMYISRLREGSIVFYDWPEQPPLLTNPVFIALILSVFAAGSHFFETRLHSKYQDPTPPISFISGRKKVTLTQEEILYVESNDSVTTVIATSDRRFKNSTPISRWEAILSPYFIRIHRSYLVNKYFISGMDADILYIGDIQLPISRKYKDAVKFYLEPK